MATADSAMTRSTVIYTWLYIYSTQFVWFIYADFRAWSHTNCLSKAVSCIA